MLQAKDYPAGSAIYSYVAPDGTNTHVDSEKLRVWCAEHSSDLEVLNTPVTAKIAMSFLDGAVIDFRHVERVLALPHLDPIIYGDVGTVGANGGPDVILIDGHHRYFAAFLCKVPFIPAYVLKPAQWHPFRIEGLPDLTEGQLRAMPTKPRSGR